MESPDQLFYHGKISRVEAEQLLSAAKMEGMYLVRTSSSTPGDYALSIYSQRMPQHFQIKSQGEVRGADRYACDALMIIFNLF